MNPATDSAKTWQWRAEWWLQGALETILRPLPGSLVHRIGALAGGLAWHLLPRRRNVVLRNLRIALDKRGVHADLNPRQAHHVGKLPLAVFVPRQR